MQQQDIEEKGKQGLADYQRVFEGNKRYVELMTAQDQNYFVNLSKGQHPKYLVIGCSDSRAPPNELTQTDPGELFIHRNIANQVMETDLNLNCVIQYAVEHLKVQNIIIMGHTKCGGVTAAMQRTSSGGLLDMWLNQIKLIYEKHQKYVDQIQNQDERVDCLCAINVREQVMNIWRNPIIQKSWDEGHPVFVHGWLFKVESGYIEDISTDVSMPEQLSTIFKLQFNQEEHTTATPGKSYQEAQQEMKKKHHHHHKHN